MSPFFSGEPAHGGPGWVLPERQRGEQQASVNLGVTVCFFIKQSLLAGAVAAGGPGG